MSTDHSAAAVSTPAPFSTRSRIATRSPNKLYSCGDNVPLRRRCRNKRFEATTLVKPIRRASIRSRRSSSTPKARRARSEYCSSPGAPVEKSKGGFSTSFATIRSRKGLVFGASKPAAAAASVIFWSSPYRIIEGLRNQIRMRLASFLRPCRTSGRGQSNSDSFTRTSV